MAQVPLFTRDPGSVTLRQVNQTTDQVLTNQIQSTVVTRSLWSDAVATTVNVATGVAMTALNLGTGMGAGDVITLGGAGSAVRVTGDLVVLGTTTSVDSETVLMADNHLYMNAGYTAAVAQTGGLVVNYLPTAVATTVAATGFVAGVAAVSNPTVNTVGAATFTAGDLVQISGAANVENNGLFEVLTHAANLLTIRGVGVTACLQDFTQNQFVTDTTVAGALTQVTVSVIRSGTDGLWEVAAGATNVLTFTDLAVGTTTLQQAYDASTAPATITTNATDQEVLITGTAGLRVTGTGANNSASPGFGFEVDTTGAFRLLGDAASTISTDTANLTFSTTTAGTMFLTSAGAITAAAVGAVSINSTGAAINVGDGADAFAINVGTGAAARTITIGNSTGATSAAINVGTGGLTLGTNATVHNVAIGSGTGASSVTIDMGTAGIAIGTGGVAAPITIGNSIGATGASIDVGTNGLQLGTNATVHTVNVGSVTGASSVTINTGTAGVAIATNAVAAAVTIGNGTGASSAVINVGSGGLDLGTTANAHTVTIGSATGASILNANLGTGGMNLGTNPVAGTITVGNATGATAVNLTSGTGEISLVATGATTDLNFTARSGTLITLNQAGDTSLVGFTATSIVGALNELAAGAGASTYTATVAFAAGQIAYVDSDNAVSLAVATADNAAARVIGGATAAITISTTGEIRTSGPVNLQFVAALTLVAGDAVYMSLTAGQATNDVTAYTAGNVIQAMGYVKDASTYTGAAGDLALVELIPGQRLVV